MRVRYPIPCRMRDLRIEGIHLLLRFSRVVLSLIGHLPAPVAVVLFMLAVAAFQWTRGLRSRTRHDGDGVAAAGATQPRSGWLAIWTAVDAGVPLILSRP